MTEWFAFVIELFQSGQGLPLLAVFVAGILFLYILGLITVLIFPVWRRSRSSHQ